MSLLNLFMKAASQISLFLLQLCYFNAVCEGHILKPSVFLACLYFAEVLGVNMLDFKKNKLETFVILL